MAEAKVLLGKNFVFRVGTKPFGCSQDASISITTTSTDTVGCREDAQAVVGNGLVPTSTRPTGYSWTVTSGALVRFPAVPGDNATMVTVPQLQIVQLAGTELDFSMDYEDENGYEVSYSGKVFITDSTLNAPLDGEAGGDFTFTGNGALAIAEVLPTA